MKTLINIPQTGLPYKKLLGWISVLVCWCLVSFPLKAQVLLSDNSISASPSSDPIVVVPEVTTVRLSALTSMDLSKMPPSWWKKQRKEHTRLLKSSNEAYKGRALQNIVFFALYYPEQVDFTRAIPRLLEIYRSDENEGYRIIALVAVHAIGNRKAMDQIRRHVSQERSERVRRHTLLALADFYKK
ncbi:MAG TPA: hypothetical protein VKP65_15990 [Rhodothermales bacterium]|nr:hypothetical protein [Rhodothermales bacterium]